MSAKPRKNDIRMLLYMIAFGNPKYEPKAQVRKTLQRHKSWFSQRNVVGLCISRKLADEKQTQNLSLQVLVRTKRPKQRLRSHLRVPKTISAKRFGIDAPVITDVLEVGNARLEMLATAKRPLFPGFNLGDQTGGSGTLSCAVRSLDDNALLGLSCAHVVADSGRAEVGSTVLAPASDIADTLGVSQRAPYAKLRRIGELKTGLKNACTNIDAATFVPNRRGTLGAAMAITLATPNGIRTSVKDGMSVTKVGARTRLTHGTVLNTDLLTSLPYEMAGETRSIWFSGLIGISRFTSSGDSGALVMDSENRAVGLHIGCYEGMSIAIPIQRVLDAMNCALA